MLGGNRLGFAGLRAARRVRRDWVVTAHSDVCIDGYPRSGNSFAVRAFRHLNPDARIAHHVHLPAQIDTAARLGTPCAVLIREPEDAISSLILFSERTLFPSVLLWSYARFYRRLECHRDRVVVLPFNSVITDPSCVVRQLNARFGTSFEHEGLGADDHAQVLNELRGEERRRGDSTMRSATPSTEKRALKEVARKAVLADPRFEAARNLYLNLVGVSGPGPTPAARQ